MHRVIIVFLPVFTVEQFNLECITLYKSKKKNSTVSKIKYIYNTIYKRLNYPGPVWFTLVLHSCHTVCGNSQSMQRRLLKTVFVARCIRGLAAKPGWSLAVLPMTSWILNDSKCLDEGSERAEFCLISKVIQLPSCCIDWLNNWLVWLQLLQQSAALL